MRFLITRPEPDASRFKEMLLKRGHDAVLAPLMTIRVLGPARAMLPGGPFQAILFTSANGVRALAARREADPLAAVPAFCVGEATARTAEAAGFQTVTHANGDADALAELVASHADPNGGPLLHVAGAVSAGNLAGMLRGQGFSVERAIIYDAEALKQLPPVAYKAIVDGETDAAAFFSPRTAELFVMLAKNAGLSDNLERIVAFALSEAVEARLRGARFRSIRRAKEPNQNALLDVIDAYTAS